VLEGERIALVSDGIKIRYSESPGSLDRVAPVDQNDDGRPDAVQATAQGLIEAQTLFRDLELARAVPLEVVMVAMPQGVDGLLLPGDRSSSVRLVVDATPQGDASGARRTAIRHYARAVALELASDYPAGWAEALGAWARLELDGQPDVCLSSLLATRQQTLAQGLLGTRYEIVAGNALWLAFVDQAYGRTALRLTLEELGRTRPQSEALDRALARTTGKGLASAFREFHLWTLLVGGLDDGQHFSFAPHLESPGFASSGDSLPTLSIQADPALSRWSATQVRLTPDVSDGGMRVHFEGDFSAIWEVDLLLLGTNGTKRRLSVPLDRGRGDHSVPARELQEAWLLVRSLGGELGGPFQYSYSAHTLKGYPFELVALEAEPLARAADGVLIRWETATEHDVIGFNVLREPSDGGRRMAVNPVWIPALGNPSAATTYRFLDRSGTAGEAYDYRIEAITRDGLTSVSDAVTVLQASPR
jgi:hypothetical protein